MKSAVNLILLCTNQKCFKAILLILCLLTCSVSRAEIVKGHVVDDETGDPLQGVRVEVTESIPDFFTTTTTVSTDSTGVYHCKISAGTQVTLTFKFFGYKETKLKRMGIGGSDTITLSDVRLKMSAELMKEVEVNARIKRFYMRGDTVVFNPQAFDVEDGDRLIELVKKLPNVSVADGKLLWNGEPLKLMMNGKDALSEGMLQEQLPVNAVANVKAYDRTSELQDRTDVADGQEEHVLDVSIKPSFMDKFLTEAKARAFTGPEYAAEAKATKLSDSDPIMLYGRVSDEPSSTSVATMGAWASNSQLLPTRQQVGAAAYRHAWRPAYEVKRDSRVDLTVGANHRDFRNKGWEDRRVFLPGTTPTRTLGSNTTLNHDLQIPINFVSALNLGPRNTLDIFASVQYYRKRKDTDNRRETTEGEELPVQINTADFHSTNEQKGARTDVNANFTHYISGGSLHAGMAVSYENARDEGFSCGEYRYLREGMTTVDRQHFTAPRHNLGASVNLGVNKSFGKHLMTYAGWNVNYAHNLRDEERSRNDVPDIENSLHRHDRNWVNTFRLNANYTPGRFTLTPSLVLAHRHEQTAYRRAALDTVARRNLLLVTPALEVSYKFNRQSRLKASVNYSPSPANIIDCIGYTDDTNPLYIREGNPDLTTAHTLRVGMLYTLMLLRHTQSLSVGAEYRKNYDPIGTVMHYDSRTGVYRVRQQNVRGGDTWSWRVTYTRELTQDLQLSNTTFGMYGRTFGILTLVDDAAGLTYNQQSSGRVEERLGLEYSHGPWQANLTNRLTWNHYAYSDEAQLTRNLYDYNVDFLGSYRLKDWKFTLCPVFMLYRGYASSRMNKGQFRLNAKVSYQFLKKRAELLLEGNDLLNHARGYMSSTTATSHTESGREFYHHYASLTFTYRFDPKGDK